MKIADLVRRRARSVPSRPSPTPTGRTGPPPPTLDLRWEELEAGELPSRRGLVRSLIDRRLDGMTVRGVLDPDEVARALRGLEGTDHLHTPSPIGSVLGMTLGDIGGETNDRSRFIDDTLRCRDVYRRAFGFDPHERVAEALAPAFPDGRLVPASEDGDDYNPGHVRWFQPGCGGLRAHVGNEFRELLEAGAMDHLVSTTRVSEHLSYFVVLQRPEQGGQLSVFDLQRETYVHPDAWEGQRDDSHFDALPRLTVDPPPGGLVVFGGGWRWHRIEPVEGRRPRITYGGFCAEAIDGPDVHFWT